MQNISIVIPLYNEEKRLPNCLKAITKYFSEYKLKPEVILVNDGSTDGTRVILKKLKKTNPNVIILDNPINKGKGSAVRQGVLAATKELILVTDCDLSTPISEINILLNNITGNDVVIGSRRVVGNKVLKGPGKFRVILGTIYYELLRKLFLPNIKDTNCGFKLFRKEVVRVVFPLQTINGWGFDAEILFICQKKGYKIKEVPVLWLHVSGSKVKVLKAIINTLSEMVSIKINNLGGKYN